MDDILFRDLEKRLRELERTVVGLQNMLRIAAEYQNEDTDKRLNGVQAALKRASEFVGRIDRRRR